MFRHVFWDFDGTLFDTYPIMSGCFRAMLLEKGIDEPQGDIEKWMRNSFSALRAHYDSKYSISDADVARHTALRAIDENANCAPFPGTEKLCRDIWESGGKNYMYTHRGRSTAIYMKKFALEDVFADYVTATDGFARKPNSQGLLYLLEKHGIDPREAIMIGDRDLDMIAAKDAGISACLFDELKLGIKGAADFIFTDFAQLYGILGIDK